jgi:hypothetical protein
MHIKYFNAAYYYTMRIKSCRIDYKYIKLNKIGEIFHCRMKSLIKIN